jgi:hypothetical protein
LVGGDNEEEERLVLVMKKTLLTTRKEDDNCRHPILYLPKSRIPGLDDDIVLSITMQLRIMSPRKRFGKAHKLKIKAQT